MLTERQLRSFCLAYGIIFVLFAIPIAALRLLLAQGAAPGETTPVLLAVQEVLCAALLVSVAVLLLRVRGAMRSPRFTQIARTARSTTIAALVVVLVGAGAVIVVPLGGEVVAGRFPTLAVSALTLMLLFFAYTGLSKAIAPNR